ncbi:MAG: fructosamine kinase family protein [Mariprofundaceae bacterium]
MTDTVEHMWDDISRAIEKACGQRFAIRHRRPVGGGCINAGYRLEGDDQRYFIKLNSADKLDMFAAEAEGLADMAAAHAVRVPEPVCWGTAGDRSFLVMEYIEFGGRVKNASSRLGEQLASMHRKTSGTYGWHRDNTIGSTPQINTVSNNWASFWRQHRLGLQLELLAQKGIGGSLQQKGQKLLADLNVFFGEHKPEASLLHGDLWGGNQAVDAKGNPVIFDPAVYYGDREADIAMTELFGGFPAAFYDAYNTAWPLDSGYSVRKTLYNLYHILNHANLFGGGYAVQAEGMMDRLLAELH